MQITIVFGLAIILTLTNAQNSNQRGEKSPFSIGLGVLSPSYSQKIGSSGSLDVMHNNDNSGFSYELSNVAHQSSPAEGRIVNDERVYYGPQYQFKSSISQGTGSNQNSDPIVSVYHTQTPNAPLKQDTQASYAPSKQDSYSPFSFQSEDDGSYQPAIPETRVKPSRQQPFDGNAQHRQYFQLEQSYQQPQRQKYAAASQPGIFAVQNYVRPRSEQQLFQNRGPLRSMLSSEPQGYEQQNTFSSYSPSTQSQRYEPQPFGSYSPFQPQRSVESTSSAQPIRTEIPKASNSPQSFDITKLFAFDSNEPQQGSSYQPLPQRQSYQPITFQSAPDRVNLVPLIPEKYLTPLNVSPSASSARDNDSRYGGSDVRQQNSNYSPQTFQNSFTF